MKILLVNKFLYPKGGSETYIFSIADYLKQKGHEVSFFGMKHEDNITQENKELMVEKLEFKGNLFTKVFYPFKIIYSIEARKKFGKLLDKFMPDVVHLNNYNYQLTPSIIYECKKRNLPIVQTIHDTNIICPYHRLYNYHKMEICEKCKDRKYFNCLKTRCIEGSFGKSLVGTAEAYLYWFLRIYSNINYLICPSRFMAEKLVEFGEDKSKIKVLHNFVVQEPKTTESKPVQEEYILYFGRLSAEKGIMTLIRAMERLKDTGIILYIAGEGELEKEIAGMNLKNLKLLGFKKGEELKQIISNSIFTVCPSEWYEPFGLTVIESQNLGKPVIGARTGGIPELIEDNLDGLLFESKNDSELAEKINYLFHNQELLKQFSQRCLVKARRFTVDLYYNRLMEIYQKAIEQQNGEVKADGSFNCGYV